MRTLKADSTLKRGNYVYTKNMRTLKSPYTKISVHKISVHKNHRTQKSAYTKIIVHLIFMPTAPLLWTVSQCALLRLSSVCWEEN